MKKEHYIPFDKEFLFEQLLAVNTVEKKEAGDFKKLFDISEHYFHYEAFNLNLKLKQHYAAFDPDLLKNERAGFVGKSEINIFKETLHKVLERGNYTRVEPEILNQALSNSDLIGLKLAIDFDDFKEYELFVRGYNKTKEKVKKFFFWKKEIELEYYDRVMIYLHYNDAAYFEREKRKLKKLPFDPSCIVLKIFKRVPKNDLETIFPNAIPKMSNLDKLLFWVPGIGGGVSLMATKVIPELIAMYAAYKAGEHIDLGNSKTGFYQGLAAFGVLGAYLFRQYSDFVNKKIRFSKMLSDSLYFKNLGNNSGAFYSLLNASEEEEHKEFMLAYTFLNKSQTPLTAEELDMRIESWFKTALKTDLDFDVEDSLLKLKNIGLCNESNGKWEVIPLNEALIRIDEIWDGIFDYNQK
ncbi:MAG: TMEM143 family protein [Bacteroidetes bacterium]|nr:TMEM143 family protein [Bacteroidota bacterium]